MFHKLQAQLDKNLSLNRKPAQRLKHRGWAHWSTHAHSYMRTASGHFLTESWSVIQQGIF